ncbi:hypothetical protein RRG08_060241 [Elysia crispata]|uniref:Uncharacterized protein n=1 Tax=Elysia crispata TaxID=231223 RepID=A0AAE0ZWZ9_9GAST|nr:hypothetical protein RRG08_060241 [Elysia crispata]
MAGSSRQTTWRTPTSISRNISANRSVRGALLDLNDEGEFEFGQEAETPVGDLPFHPTNSNASLTEAGVGLGLCHEDAVGRTVTRCSSFLEHSACTRRGNRRERLEDR